MGITLRNVTGSALTYNQMDENFRFLSQSYFYLSGSNVASGSLILTGSIEATEGITGSFSGSFIGTASYASNALSASYSVSSSYAFNATSASYALSASYAVNVNARGNDTQIQFNSASVFSGDSSFIFNYVSQSLQQGLNTSASGQYSHAEGSSSLASGTASHAEGWITTASGQYSHAEGRLTNAIGLNSHAEGYNTTARAGNSHAEGHSTVTSGSNSHAEGFQTIARGTQSHAEGFITIASGSNSHAEGEETLATGRSSHVEGYKTTTLGDYSHAEGSSSIALGIASHAEGLYTIANGDFQHTIGQYNISSSAQSAFIIGNGTGDSNRSNLLFASGSSVQITGSLTVSGSGTFTNIGPAVFSGSVDVSGSTTFIGTHILSGSNTITGNTILSGSIDVSGSSNFHNTIFIVTGSQFYTGSSVYVGHQTITGSLSLTSNGIGTGLYINGQKQFNYISVFHTASITPTQNISGSFIYSTVATSSGITINNNSRITFANTGIYNIQFSAQLYTQTGATVDIWFKKDGTNIANSGTKIGPTSNGDYLVAAWNFVENVSSGSYIEIAYQSDQTNTQFQYIAATGNIPAIPSIIASVTQIA